MEIRKIDLADRKPVDAFIVQQWFTPQMVVHGESIDIGLADGWYAFEENQIIGLITYRIVGHVMEILSLDSLHENRGIGTALLHRAIADAKSAGCSRIILTTTNDNLSALRFYQKRGFDMSAFRRNALDQVRMIKPEIPLTGMDGIPLRHEIDLELLL